MYQSLTYVSDSARHLSQDIFPPISQIVLKNFMKINIIIKECPEEILIKLAIVLKISKSSWNIDMFWYKYQHTVTERYKYQHTVTEMYKYQHTVTEMSNSKKKPCFFYFNLFLSATLDILSCSFTSISFLYQYLIDSNE